LIYAGLAEYVALLTSIGGGITFTSIEPTVTVVVIVGVAVFLFWLVVFKL